MSDESIAIDELGYLGLNVTEAIDDLQKGLPTLRDRFAMAALQGLLASGPHDCKPNELCAEAYMYADALLAKRLTPSEKVEQKP